MSDSDSLAIPEVEKLFHVDYELENDSYCRVAIRLSTTGNSSRLDVGGDARVVSVDLIGAGDRKCKYDRVRLVGPSLSVEGELVLDDARFEMVSPVPRITEVLVRREADEVWVPMLVRYKDPAPALLLAQADVAIFTWQCTPRIY